jgi:hypothetical protein
MPEQIETLKFYSSNQKLDALKDNGSLGVALLVVAALEIANGHICFYFY